MTTIATNENHSNRGSASEEMPVVQASAPVVDDEKLQPPTPVTHEAPARVSAASASDDGPDPDMPFFQQQQADRVPPPPIVPSGVAATLSPVDTLDCARLLLERIFVSPAVRLEYYNRSRSWHKRSGGTDHDGGDYERQWLRMLANELPDNKGASLNANDFGNIHQAMFLTLRRAMLAVTGHDVHPNPFAAGIRSFHFIPNDTSQPAGTYNPKTDLGFALDQP